MVGYGMAIYRPADGFVGKIVVDGVMYTQSAQGDVQMVPATTNRGNKGAGTAGDSTPQAIGSTRPEGGSASKAIGQGKVSSRGFTELDQTITRLDASYDVLVDQSGWIADAAEMDGLWNLCASCQPDAAGKKFYRQYNFNRLITGDVVVPDAPVITDFDPPVPGVYVYVTVLVPPVILLVSDGDQPYDEWLVAQVGLGLGNPLWLMRQFDETSIDPASAGGQILLAVAVGDSLPVCCFDGDFVPRTTTTLTRLPDI